MARRKKQSPQAKRNAQLYKKMRPQLVRIIGVTFNQFGDLNWTEIAEETSLSIATLQKLYYGAWIYPRFHTIQKLCSPVGYDLTLKADGEIEVELNENHGQFTKV